MQHSHPTFAFKPLILFPPTLHFLPLHPHHHLMLLAVSLYLLLSLPLPDSLKILQWNAGGLRARSTGSLHFISSHPVGFICIQESNLNLSSSFRIPGFSALRSDRSHSRSGIFLLMSQTLGAASSYSSGRAYPSLSFLPPLFHRSIPTLIMYGSKSLQTSPPRSHFLMFMLALYALLRRIAEPISFFLLHKSLYSGRLQLPSFPLGLKKYFPPLWGESIRLGHLF